MKNYTGRTLFASGRTFHFCGFPKDREDELIHLVSLEGGQVVKTGQPANYTVVPLLDLEFVSEASEGTTVNEIYIEGVN